MCSCVCVGGQRGREGGRGTVRQKSRKCRDTPWPCSTAGASQAPPCLLATDPDGLLSGRPDLNFLCFEILCECTLCHCFGCVSLTLTTFTSMHLSPPIFDTFTSCKDETFPPFQYIKKHKLKVRVIDMKSEAINIARIKNAVQCHNQLSGNKVVMNPGSQLSLSLY